MLSRRCAKTNDYEFRELYEFYKLLIIKDYLIRIICEIRSYLLVLSILTHLHDIHNYYLTIGFNSSGDSLVNISTLGPSFVNKWMMTCGSISVDGQKSSLSI